ncbi:uncharacterized protein [Miscanthus floridulus]|uniref:uncharacterized protein n=1 Tax=Miscanthus floridulus TaxID=154761 RepID=UPI00345A134C
MAMLSLARLTFGKRRRGRHRLSRRRTQADGSNASSEARKKASPSRKVGNSGAAKRTRSHLTLDRLPQDVLNQIVALLPMQDAARAACISQELLLSWRYYPELSFSRKKTSFG